MNQGAELPGCPLCQQATSVRPTLRVTFGTYYFCDACRHMWCREVEKRDPDDPLSDEQVEVVRRMRKKLGFDPIPKIH